MAVYTGSKPGRPRLALFVAAAALACTLGMAWLQVRAKRMLQSEVAIDGTPLIVRPPLGWHQAENEPGRFFLPAPAPQRRRGIAFSKDVRVSYKRQRFFVSPVTPDRHLPTTLAGLPAVQSRVRKPTERQPRLVDHVVSRVTCSPRGDVIRIDYVTRTGLTMADLELLDQIAASVRIQLPNANADPSQALERVGVSVPLEDDWIAALPDVEQVAGCYIGGTIKGIPAWSLGIYRTWLAHGREPDDLLTDFAALYWEAEADALTVVHTQRGDGVQIAHVTTPIPGQHPIAAAWLVSKSASEAVIIPVFATLDVAIISGEAAAAQIVEALEFTATGGIPDIAAAEAAGRELAGVIHEQGVQTWWGSAPQRTYYLVHTVRGREAWLSERAPVGERPVRGYRGAEFNLHPDGDRRQSWSVDMSDAQPWRYQFYFEENVSGRLGRRRLQNQATESRKAGSGHVSRTRVNSGLHSETDFTPGAAFICPAVDSIAEYLVASETEGAWMIEGSDLIGRGSHTRLLRPMSTDDPDDRRVLAQSDVFPFGVVLTYDADATLRAAVYPSAALERVSREEAEARFPELRGVSFEGLSRP